MITERWKTRKQTLHIHCLGLSGCVKGSTTEERDTQYKNSGQHGPHQHLHVRKLLESVEE